MFYGEPKCKHAIDIFRLTAQVLSTYVYLEWFCSLTFNIFWVYLFHMLNKHYFRKSVFLFTALLVVTGAIAATFSASSEAYPTKGKNHKDMAFGAI